MYFRLRYNIVHHGRTVCNKVLDNAYVTLATDVYYVYGMHVVDSRLYVQTRSHLDTHTYDYTMTPKIRITANKIMNG